MRKGDTVTYPTELFARARYGVKDQSEAVVAATELLRKVGAKAKVSAKLNDKGARCAICGRDDVVEGFSMFRKEILSDSFGEQSTLADAASPVGCPYCALTLTDEMRATSGIVVWSGDFRAIVGATSLGESVEGKKKKINIGRDKLIGKEAVVKYLLTPPEGPFIIAFNSNFSGKNGGHYVHTATVNYSPDEYFVNEADNTFLVSTGFLRRFLSVLEENEINPGLVWFDGFRKLYDKIKSGTLPEKVKYFSVFAGMLDEIEFNKDALEILLWSLRESKPGKDAKSKKKGAKAK